MPYPAQRLKLVPYGTIGSDQTWSTTVQVHVELTGGAWGLNDLAVVATALEVYFSTWWHSEVRTVNLATVKYLGMRAYYYVGVGDHASLQADIPASNGGAGSGTDALPVITSVVASLRTAGVGRSYRGRSYMPLTGINLDGDGQIGTGICDAIAGAYQALLNSINAYTNGTHLVASLEAQVMSATLSSGHKITSVRVDSEPDTQHRRNDKLAASYTAVVPIT